MFALGLLILLLAAPVESAPVVTITTPTTYQVASLAVGSPYYIDRTYTLVTIPTALQGAIWIKTANNDKAQTATAWLTFTLDQAAVVSVAYSQGASVLPGWLSSWMNTGLTLGTSDVPLQVYAQTFPAGAVTLGGNLAAPAAGSTEHYVVAIQAATPLSWSIPGVGATFTKEATLGTLQLDWQDNASDETGTRVERRLASDPTFVQVADLALPDLIAFTDGTLTLGLAYCYRLRAYNAAGVSDPSNEACGTAR